MKEAVIVSSVRTPLGSFNGTLSNVGATQLGALVIKEAINRAGIPQKDGRQSASPSIRYAARA
jgi:acetyl-CoA C-acetyltransferase